MYTVHAHSSTRAHLTNTLTHANAHYLARTKPFTPCAAPQLASHARIRPIAAADVADGGGGDGCCYCCCDVDVVVDGGGGCCCGLHPQPLGALSAPPVAIAVKGPTPTPPS